MATETPTPILLQSKSGPDGKLHLVVPVGQADAEFEVELVVRPKRAPGLGRPPGYSALFNSIDDETFDVPPEPPMPPPVEIE